MVLLKKQADIEGGAEVRSEDGHHAHKNGEGGYYRSYQDRPRVCGAQEQKGPESSARENGLVPQCWSFPLLLKNLLIYMILIWL